MTTPNFADAPPLLTDADVVLRVEQLVGPAAADRTLWIMWVDGDGRQAPVVMPVEDLPRRPESDMLDGLAAVLGGLRDELVTDLGSGSVILTLERLGPDRVSPDDRTWVDALATSCERAEMGLRGVFLSTRGGVRRMR
ncbi:MAG: hypothetical protein GEV09_02690 [Pseudonocardiaceae bacterium]|nr:hypothetical protein [Pseudonocardiaceae bacterium]